MNKQATKRIFLISLFILIISNIGISKEVIKSISHTTTNPTKLKESIGIQGDLLYIYGLYDEGLMDSKQLYKVDRLLDNYNSNSIEVFLIEYDAIDFEMYTKQQEFNIKH